MTPRPKFPLYPRLTPFRIYHRLEPRPPRRPKSNGEFYIMKKTHCFRGHPMADPNLYYNRGKRYCLTCIRIRSAMTPAEIKQARADRMASRPLPPDPRIARHRKLLARIEALQAEADQVKATLVTPRTCKNGHPLTPGNWGCPTCRAEFRRSTNRFSKRALGYAKKKGA